MKQVLTQLFRSCARSLQQRRGVSPTRRRPLLEALEDRAVPASIAVTLATDPLGAHTGTSVRDAIKAVNAGLDNTITFNIPGSGAQIIHLHKALPAIAKAVTIDGTTQPGYTSTPLIGLTRANNGVGGDGLTFTGGATVKGLAVYGFATWGLHFKHSGGNNVLGDYVGVTPGGAAAGNGAAGIFLDDVNNDVIASSNISNNGHRGINVEGSAHVLIGGVGAGNTISNNGPSDPTWAGIAIHHGSWDVTVSNNTLTGNGRGIRISGAGNLLPAGSTWSINILNNTITGNTTQGVWIDNALGGAAHNVLLQGNDIEKNGGVGIRMEHSSNVGFTSNTVSNNTKDGILIGKGSQKVSFNSNTINSNKGYGVVIKVSSVSAPDATNTILNNSLGAVHLGN
jgi:parallel beta-helix repeat protein